MPSYSERWQQEKSPEQSAQEKARKQERGRAKRPAPGWYWNVVVSGQPMASFSVEKMGKKQAKKAAKEYGKIYIGIRGPGFPQLKLTNGFPAGSRDMTPPDSLLEFMS
jgi:hypothetical protein